MKAMATSLLACAMALLAMSEFQAEDCDESVAESMRTELLQSTAVLANTHTRVHTHARTHARPVQLDGDKSSEQSITPVFFLHIPKCGGTTLAKVLLLFDGVCSKMTDQERENLLAAQSFGSIGKRWGVNYSEDTWEDMCSLVDLRSSGYAFGDHSGIGSLYSKYIKGHGLTVLRQPEQRILSGYGDAFHSWRIDLFGRKPSSHLEYAKVVAGCAVKMLTRDGQAEGQSSWGSSVCGDPVPPTNDETTLAIERLAEGFPYVGITEEWTQSICLLHAMFGGTCTAHEFASENAGSSSANSTAGYDTSVLEGWTDEHDGKLYAEGMRLFQNSLQHFQVNTESCMLCMQEAGVL